MTPLLLTPSSKKCKIYTQPSSPTRSNLSHFTHTHTHTSLRLCTDRTMETMEYNYFSPASQQYDYMAFDAESSSSDLGVTPVSSIICNQSPPSARGSHLLDLLTLLLTDPRRPRQRIPDKWLVRVSDFRHGSSSSPSRSNNNSNNSNLLSPAATATATYHLLAFSSFITPPSSSSPLLLFCIRW